jgi:hypothetical protein
MFFETRCAFDTARTLLPVWVGQVERAEMQQFGQLQLPISGLLQVLWKIGKREYSQLMFVYSCKE